MIGGRDIQTLDLKWWRSQIGLVQQEPFTFSTSIYNNVAHGLVGSKWKFSNTETKMRLVKEACIEAFADKFITRLPLVGSLTHYGKILGLTSHDLVKELAACGTAVDLRDAESYTPLMWAARRGDHKIVQLLLEAGANLNACDRISATPLIQAALSLSVLCVKLLLHAGADPHYTNKLNYSAFHYMA